MGMHSESSLLRDFRIRGLREIEQSPFSPR